MVEKLKHKTLWFLFTLAVLTGIFAWTIDFDKVSTKLSLNERAAMVMEKK